MWHMSSTVLGKSAVGASTVHKLSEANSSPYCVDKHLDTICAPSSSKARWQRAWIWCMSGNSALLHPPFRSSQHVREVLTFEECTYFAYDERDRKEEFDSWIMMKTTQIQSEKRFEVACSCWYASTPTIIRQDEWALRGSHGTIVVCSGHMHASIWSW